MRQLSSLAKPAAESTGRPSAGEGCCPVRARQYAFRCLPRCFFSDSIAERGLFCAGFFSPRRRIQGGGERFRERRACRRARSGHGERVFPQPFFPNMFFRRRECLGRAAQAGQDSSLRRGFPSHEEPAGTGKTPYSRRVRGNFPPCPGLFSRRTQAVACPVAETCRVLRVPG